MALLFGTFKHMMEAIIVNLSSSFKIIVHLKIASLTLMSLVMDMLVCLCLFIFMPYTRGLCNFSALEIHRKGKSANCFFWKYAGWLLSVINAACFKVFLWQFGQCNVYRVYTHTHTYLVKENTAIMLNICRGLSVLKKYEIHHSMQLSGRHKAVSVHRSPRSCYRRQLQSNFLSAHETSLALVEWQNTTIISHPA